MQLISLNLGHTREVVWKNQTVTTGIFKTPVSGPVALRPHNLAGDTQADLTVHGGPHQAVYLYPSEHYAHWRAEFPDLELPWGMFGENFTTTGIFENEMLVGDRLQIGTAIVRVTIPRVPCYKLGLRFGRDDIIKRFLASGRSGLYLALESAGEVATGATFTRLSRPDHTVTIADINRVYAHDKGDTATLQRILAVPNLPDVWRQHFQTQLQRHS